MQNGVLRSKNAVQRCWDAFKSLCSKARLLVSISVAVPRLLGVMLAPMLAPKMAQNPEKIQKNRNKIGFQDAGNADVHVYRIYNVKMTPQNRKNQYLSLGILWSNAYRRF